MTSEKDTRLHLKVNDRPPWKAALLFGLQVIYPGDILAIPSSWLVTIMLSERCCSFTVFFPASYHLHLWPSRLSVSRL